jgi:hypothetical protein
MGNGGNLPGVIYFFVFSLVEDYPRLSYQNMKEPIKYVVYGVAVGISVYSFINCKKYKVKSPENLLYALHIKSPSVIYMIN